MTEYRIWPATNGPDTSGSDGQPINLGTEFYVTSAAWLTAIRWYRGTVNVTPDNLRLYQVDSASAGTMLAEVTSPAAVGAGWQVSEVDPVELTPHQRYKVVAHVPDDYTPTGGYWTTGGPGEGGITNGILVAPDTSQAAGGGQGTFKYGAIAFPDGTFGGGNYWVDVVIDDVNPGGEVRVVLDLAVETDTAHAGTSAHVVPLALATETDTAQPGAIVRVVPLQLAIETDAVHPATASKVVVLNQAVELDSAHSVSPKKVVPLALAVEQDTALPITVSGVLLVPGVHTASSAVSNLSASSSVSRLEAT